MNDSVNINRKIALKILNEFSNAFNIPLKIGNIDKLAKKMLIIIDKANDEDDRINRETNVVNALSFYLGDELISKNGGEWFVNDEGEYSVVLKNNTKLYPFTKVRKFLENGDPDSLVAFFTTASIFG